MSAARSQSDVALRFAAEHADRHLHARELGALELDGIDAREEVDRRVRDEPGVQAGSGRRAASRPRAILVVVGDQGAQLAGVARLGERLGLVHERADLVLGRAGGSAGGAGEEREQERRGYAGNSSQRGSASVTSYQRRLAAHEDVAAREACRADRRGCRRARRRSRSTRRRAAPRCRSGGRRPGRSASRPAAQSSRRCSSPRIQVSCSRLKNALVACAALRARRQREQWQFCTISGRPASSKATSPHRQRPRMTRASPAGARALDRRRRPRSPGGTSRSAARRP